MATTQQVVATLKKSGKHAQKFEKGVGLVQRGFTVAKWNKGLVGLLANSSDPTEIASYKQTLETAGFKVWRPAGAAVDGLFVQ